MTRPAKANVFQARSHIVHELDHARLAFPNGQESFANTFEGPNSRT